MDDSGGVIDIYEVECPYCGCECEIDCIESDCFDVDCESCEKEFEVNVEYDPTLTATEIHNYDCVECGKRYRWYGDWSPWPKKYKSSKVRLCEPCRHKGVIEDMEQEFKARKCGAE